MAIIIKPIILFDAGRAATQVKDPVKVGLGVAAALVGLLLMIGILYVTSLLRIKRPPGTRRASPWLTNFSIAVLFLFIGQLLSLASFASDENTKPGDTAQSGVASASECFLTFGLFFLYTTLILFFFDAIIDGRKTRWLSIVISVAVVVIFLLVLVRVALMITTVAKPAANVKVLLKAIEALGYLEYALALSLGGFVLVHFLLRLKRFQGSGKGPAMAIMGVLSFIFGVEIATGLVATALAPRFDVNGILIAETVGSFFGILALSLIFLYGMYMKDLKPPGSVTDTNTDNFYTSDTERPVFYSTHHAGGADNTSYNPASEPPMTYNPSNTTGDSAPHVHFRPSGESRSHSSTTIGAQAESAPPVYDNVPNPSARQSDPAITVATDTVPTASDDTSMRRKTQSATSINTLATPGRPASSVVEDVNTSSLSGDSKQTAENAGSNSSQERLVIIQRAPTKGS